MTSPARNPKGDVRSPTKPKPFIVCYESHRAAQGGYPWSVRQGRTWLPASDICVQVPIVTVYRGPTARQPRAYLRGVGIVSRRGTRVVISC